MNVIFTVRKKLKLKAWSPSISFGVDLAAAEAINSIENFLFTSDLPRNLQNTPVCQPFSHLTTKMKIIIALDDTATLKKATLEQAETEQADLNRVNAEKLD